MRIIVSILVANVFLTGCVSGSGPESRLPNYVTSQANQGPAIRNDTFGGSAMPMRGLPR
jgi:PBP1b-binding outer membrane lipoprotein LpoB